MPGTVGDELIRIRRFCKRIGEGEGIDDDFFAALAVRRDREICKHIPFRERIGIAPELVILRREPVRGPPRDIGRIDAYSDRANASGIEFSQALFDTPQLGVTGWSPIASVKDEQHALRCLSADGSLA